MQLIRTTIRLPQQMKTAVEITAIKQRTTFQPIVTQAISQYMQKNTTKNLKKIKFMSKNLGSSLDNLTREEIYAD